MTQYTEIVEKQKEKLSVEEWGKKIYMIYVHNGIVETYYNNGLIEYRNDEKGTWYKKSKQTYKELLCKMQKEKVDKERM